MGTSVQGLATACYCSRMALFLGYDPGGKGAHGVAQVEIDVDSGRVLRASSTRTATADAALAYLVSATATTTERAGGLGVDTLTEWCLGPSGWRQADLWLRATYPKAANSVISANSIYGSMCVNGVGLIHALRRQDPGLVVTETHPKVLYFALAGVKYDWALSRPQMVAWIRDLLGQPSMDVPSSDEFDALLSAWACAQGVLGHWKRDLHVPVPGSTPGGTVVRPVGSTHYFWP